MAAGCGLGCPFPTRDCCEDGARQHTSGPWGGAQHTQVLRRLLPLVPALLGEARGCSPTFSLFKKQTTLNPGSKSRKGPDEG